MPDALFAHPRLAALYDANHPDRDDLDAYLAIARELGARAVLDIGCGTGTFVMALLADGRRAIGLDPAAASLDVARGKPGAQHAQWILGDARALPPLQVDLVTMTGNVAQAIVDPPDWAATLRGAHAALRPGGHLVFETRVPARRQWESWTKDQSWSSSELPHIGRVEQWVQVTAVAEPLVSFRWTWIFQDGQTLSSDSTLRFRERDEVEADLADAGFEVQEVRDAPDRPGLEYVFIARRRVDS